MLDALVRGEGYKQVADRYGISLSAVGSTISSAFGKLGASERYVALQRWRSLRPRARIGDTESMALRLLADGVAWDEVVRIVNNTVKDGPATA